MFVKNSLAALASAALAQQALAINPHRHGHGHLHQKKAIEWAATETEVITDWVYVTVHPGQQTTTPVAHTAAVSTPSAVDTPSSTATPTPSSTTSTSSTPAPTPTSSTSSSPSPTSSSSTSTTSSSTPSTTSSTPAPTPTTSSVLAPPTTLATQIKEVVTPKPESEPAPSTTTAAAAPATSDDGFLGLGIDFGLGDESTTSSAPAAATTTAASSGSGSGSGVSTGSKKRGAAYNKNSLVSMLTGGNSEVSWKYNWAATPQGEGDNLEFVPMMWGLEDWAIKGWDASADEQINKGATHLLSFNEPDNEGQAALTVAQAVEGHKKYMNPYSDKARISTPAVTNSGSANQGLDWLSQWIDQCNGECAYDFCAVHWYAPPDTDYFLSHLKKAAEVCGDKPVWLTEFQPSGSTEQVQSFLKEVMHEMDTNAELNVERYAYFMVAEGKLLSGSILNSIGKFFAFGE